MLPKHHRRDSSRNENIEQANSISEQQETFSRSLYQTQQQQQTQPQYSQSLASEMIQNPMKISSESDLGELQRVVTEYARRNQLLIEKNVILENDLLLSRSYGSSTVPAGTSKQFLRDSSRLEDASAAATIKQQSYEKQLQSALVEKLRLEEIMEFMREESIRFSEEAKEARIRAENAEIEVKERVMELAASQSQTAVAQAHAKRIEEQLKLANIHFVNAQKKITNLERETKDVTEKLIALESDKKRISKQWAAASAKLKSEEKLRLRVRELESELLESQAECDDFKRKYVNSNTELRVFKEGECNYKDLVEARWKELRGKWGDDAKELDELRRYKTESLRVRDELVKQNSDLLLQLEECSIELRHQADALESLRITGDNLLACKTEAESTILSLQAQVQASAVTIAELQEIIKQKNASAAESAAAAASARKQQQQQQQQQINDCNSSSSAFKSDNVTHGREELTKRILLANAQIQRNEATILEYQDERAALTQQISDLSLKNEDLTLQLRIVLHEVSNKQGTFGSGKYNDQQDAQAQLKDLQQLEQNESKTSLLRLIASKCDEKPFIDEIQDRIIALLQSQQQIHSSMKHSCACSQENKILYDRLLVKYFHLQQKLSSIQIDGNQSSYIGDESTVLHPAAYDTNKLSNLLFSQHSKNFMNSTDTIKMANFNTTAGAAATRSALLGCGGVGGISHKRNHSSSGRCESMPLTKQPPNNKLRGGDQSNSHMRDTSFIDNHQKLLASSDQRHNAPEQMNLLNAVSASSNLQQYYLGAISSNSSTTPSTTGIIAKPAGIATPSYNASNTLRQSVHFKNPSDTSVGRVPQSYKIPPTSNSVSTGISNLPLRNKGKEQSTTNNTSSLQNNQRKPSHSKQNSSFEHSAKDISSLKNDSEVHPNRKSMDFSYMATHQRRNSQNNVEAAAASSYVEIIKRKGQFQM